MSKRPIPASFQATLSAAIISIIIISSTIPATAEDATPVTPLTPLSPKPLPTLPPEARTMQIPSSDNQANSTSSDKAQQQNLIDDITQMKVAVERVRAALASNADTSDEENNTGKNSDTARSEHAPSQQAKAPDGARRDSQKMGAERLNVQRFSDGSALVNAAIDRQPAETVYRELAVLAGRVVDDTQITGTRRPVSVHLKDAPLEDVLDRVLGQIGMSWRAEDSGSNRLIVITDALPGGDLDGRIERALTQASRDHNTVNTAEALYLMASHASASGHHVEAMRLYAHLAEEFRSAQEPVLKAWMLHGLRGVADAMLELQQFRDARGMYMNYISRSDEHDPDLPSIYVSAAEAGRKLGVSKQDPTAFDEAIDILHTLLERLSGVATAAPQIHLARLTIGELLFQGGRYREAETQLKLFADAGGGRTSDQIAFWLAECSFQQEHYGESRIAFEKLYRSWKAHHTDTQAPASIYAVSAFRIGLCDMKEKEPKYVHALFAFLRAKQDFPHAGFEAEILIGIARCYAELERDDDTVSTLWELLKTDAVADSRPGQMQLDQMLGELEGSLGDYTGPVRAKILFYIGQADYRRAMRDRRVRATAADDAVHHYERVLTEQPSAELRYAAKLGLARSAFLGGQDDRAVATLKELLTDPGTAPRDREFAAALLGNHYRDIGKLREAIKAFRGEVE